MTIQATVIADSISDQGIRLTTMQLRYPRFIHAEVMTHRTFSRNASSSRAIPVAKMIEDLRRDPAIPVYWGSNKPGMQAGAAVSENEQEICQNIWLNAMETAIDYVQDLISYNLHKQIANRILEPWAHINVLVTATDYANFFALRRHPDAQPEIKALADAMWLARFHNDPLCLKTGDWHLPYLDWETIKHNSLNVCKKISVARCARVSYLTHDGRQTTVQEDLELFDRLMGSSPLHASPAEHQATPDQRYLGDYGDEDLGWSNPELHGNLRGWIQLRKTFPNEFVAG